MKPQNNRLLQLTGPTRYNSAALQQYVRQYTGNCQMSQSKGQRNPRKGSQTSGLETCVHQYFIISRKFFFTKVDNPRNNQSKVTLFILHMSLGILFICCFSTELARGLVGLPLCEVHRTSQSNINPTQENISATSGYSYFYVSLRVIS